MKLSKCLFSISLLSCSTVLAQQPYCQIKCAAPMIAACSGIPSSVSASSEDFKCACCLPNYGSSPSPITQSMLLTNRNVASCGTNTAGLCCSGLCEAGHCRPVPIRWEGSGRL
ncbi:hypothetical protein Vi05172_g4264 [Venturia inaequalis]|nr:hypothetical protein Vi05172_g4264 [Venturia inaequalis]